ncbi:MAG: hypothetical protein LUG91_07815 [Ruminococcus sp.]|nr:hypothetical protein [Ruminococcus sp.]
MAETVSGNFTFTILDEENTLYFVKGSSPLYLLHFKKLGIYVYASTPSIMKEALELCHFPKSKYDVVKVSDGEILRIASDGGIAKDRFQISSDWYSDYSFWNEPDYGDDDELDLLLEVCNCFGMTEDDVFEWLEYGLSCAEIEEILMKPRAFRNG